MIKSFLFVIYIMNFNLRGIHIQYFIAFAVLYFVMIGHTFCSCSKLEGFKTESQFSKYNDDTYNVNTSSWSGVKTSGEINSRPKQPIPLAPNQMLMFSETKFKPECCPNTYSSSTGCACMTMNQYDYLRARGQKPPSFPEY
jgi:hypothetical protein